MSRQYSVLVFTILLVTAVAVAQSSFGQQHTSAQTVAPDVTTIVGRMEQAQEENRTRQRAYTMVRDYRLYGNPEDQPKSEVIAEVMFQPPTQKTYRINWAEGNDRGKTIVEHLLSSEVEATRKNSPARIDRRNYDFGFIGEDRVDGSPCWILQLRPKREEKNLISGRAWVDKNTFLLRRLEGDMAKNPSWWIRRVYVTVSFGNVSGMWLQTGTRAVADVRFVGRHTLVGEAVRVQTNEAVAYLRPDNQIENRNVRVVNRSRAASTALGTILAEH